MLDDLLSYLAPHLCCECNKIGQLLCDNCKYDITSEAFYCCIVCGKVAGKYGLCRTCRPPYERAWCVGERTGGLQRLIGRYKFQNARAAHQPLGELLLNVLDQLPTATVIVPVPTVASHIRQRGYDHTLLLAWYIAKKRKLELQEVLERTTRTMQRHTTRQQRAMQAKAAFRAKKELRDDIPYLLVDDVVTTGATLHYAAHELKKAGTRTIWVAALARQPLD